PLWALDRCDRHDRLARVARGRPLGGMLGRGPAGRGVGGRSRSQCREGGRGRERHNRGRCPPPDYLCGLGRRASICHAMSRLSGRNRIETKPAPARGNGAVQKARIIVPVARATIVLIEVGSCGRALWTRPTPTASVTQASASITTFRCVRRLAASSQKLFMTCPPRCPTH